MMDTAAGIAALRHARTVCVTASVDRVDFREPIHIGDLVVMKASVNYVGRPRWKSECGWKPSTFSPASAATPIPAT
jgi:Acyl-CoA hydrolase